ncbi:MAG: hypothetical protein M0P69_17615 [Bacteroidales bacterium]|nr:hypothetical protein [Bacteroidales bacterium]
MNIIVKRVPNVRRVDLSAVDAEVNEFIDYVTSLIDDEPFEVQSTIRSEAAALATEWNFILRTN